MLRLTIRSQTPQEVVLQVDGWVSGADVEILAQEGPDQTLKVFSALL